MPRLLFEIGCEELPAAACMEAGLQLPELVREHLGAHPLELFIGPRRLAFPVDLPEQTADEWIKGPPENLREKAAAGFAKKHGVSVDDLRKAKDAVTEAVAPVVEAVETKVEGAVEEAHRAGAPGRTVLYLGQPATRAFTTGDPTR